MRVRFWFCIFLLSACPVIASTDLLWPLQKNYGISATFGESRQDHYHAGIDLSTNGRTGLPVLAIADGSIYRMKVQKRGYGKALYIQHANGLQSVYAHLEGYSKELGLDRLYRDRISKTGTPYVGDIFVEPPVRVKQGQIVAFSGESGAGLPHLHLEMRRNEVLAINPLSSGLRDPMDSISPTFQACYIYPLTVESAVNGDLDTKEIRLKKDQSVFRADTSPVVRGEFGVSVSVYDSTIRPYRRNPQKITYSLDDQEMYSVEFDQFSYSEPQGFGLLYDLGKPGPSYFEYPILLTKTTNFSLPFVKRAAQFSTRSLSAGAHLLRIVATDANGNSSIAEVPFVVNHPPTMDFDTARADQSGLMLGTRIVDPNWTGQETLTGEVEYSIDGGETYQPILSTSVVPSKEMNVLQLQYRIAWESIQNAKSIVIRGRAFDSYEYSSYQYSTYRINPALLNAAPSSERETGLPPGDLSYETYRDTIRITFQAEAPVTQPLQISFGDPQVAYQMRSKKPATLIADIPAPKQNGNFVLSLTGGQSVSVPVNFVKANGPAVIKEKDIRLSIGENSLYKDAWIWSKLLPQYASKSLPLIAPILELGPRGLPLKKSATLSFQYPPNFADPEKLSIYQWSRTAQTWQSLPSKLSRGTQTVEAKIDSLDLFALIYDNVAPRISTIFPKPRSSTRNASPVLAVHVRDTGMDIDDGKISLYVDGIPYAAEYDPDRNTATAKVTGVLRSGNHSFYAVAYDYAGNKTQSATINFRVR